MGRRARDYRGQRYGRLLVLVRDGSDKFKAATWKCRCDCGRTTIVVGQELIKGTTKSCGCLQKELARELMVRHGHTRTKVYAVWASMIARCSNPDHQAWKRYGGRGIKVCQRWHKFENFLTDMGQPPLKKSLDRINNGKGYYKNNCRWASRKVQANNRG